jgi:hypothetical protein
VCAPNEIICSHCGNNDASSIDTRQIWNARVAASNPSRSKVWELQPVSGLLHSSIDDSPDIGNSSLKYNVDVSGNHTFAPVVPPRRVTSPLAAIFGRESCQQTL